jgi:hypothetical protein
MPILSVVAPEITTNSFEWSADSFVCYTAILEWVIVPSAIVLKGIWLCEHRDNATPRKVVVTLSGI